MTTHQILESYTNYKETTLYGRYITQEDIQPLLTQWANTYEIKKIGESENQLPIHLIKIGKGKKNLLLWSQMHGNESTTTKALFDVLHFFNDASNILARDILNQCTLYIVPILNPDGAKLYTRANFNGVDLNRDAQDLSQKESKLFKSLVDEINPVVSFNLHGQRTIFSAGETSNSAVVSFLSPASDSTRTVTKSRKRGMSIISTMNDALQTYIPNCVGRYDDSFNINCIGDTMEAKGYTTILFEAGHHPNDYEREITRKWIFLSLITALKYISKEDLTDNRFVEYFNIPENRKLFKDILIRNYALNGKKVDVAIYYKEMLNSGNLEFVPKILQINSQITDNGHIELDASVDEIKIYNVLEDLKIGSIIDYLSINNEKFSVFPIKK